MSTIQTKNIYLIATGANQARNLDAIVRPLNSFSFNVYVFPTYNCQKIINLHEMNLNAPIVDETYDKNSNPLPLEDLVLVAPCTFNTLNKISLGIADNYQMSLLHTALGRGTKIIIALAMNENYWKHFRTKQSIDTITMNIPNAQIIWPEFVYTNDGKLEKITMSPTDKIVDSVINVFAKLRYKNKQVPITQEYTNIINDNFESFCKLGEMMVTDYYSKGTQGFISKRINDKILITCHNSQIGSLSKQEMTLIHYKDEDDTIVWEGYQPPSSESPLVMEIYKNTNFDTIIHGHCNRITYSPFANLYATTNYITTGNTSKIGEITDKMTNNDGKVILKLHGEIIGANTFKDALYKYKELYYTCNKTR